MITRKKTLEMATPRRTGDEESARARELIPDVLERVELTSPLDDLEFGETELETSSIESPENQEKPQKPETPPSVQSPSSPVVAQPSVETGKVLSIYQRYQALQKYNKLIFAGLAILALIIGLHLLGKQPYTVETRLMFIVADRKALERENWSPMRELSLLQNPKTSSILSSRYFNIMDPMNIFNKVDANSIDNLFSQSTSVNPMSVRKDLYRTPAEFESWLSRSISFEPDFYGGQNGVSIKLTGADPQLLKGVLVDYVSSYVDMRRMISAKAREKSGTHAPAVASENSANLKNLENLKERIRKLDTLLSDYQMAMKLLESNNGSTNSFSLDPSSPIFPTVARFQDKIIQLEIERGALETRFTPQSREIKSLEYQIDGVKGLLNQYIIEQVKYLDKDKEMLMAQKTELENSSQRKAENTEAEEKKDMSKSSGMLASGAKWYFLNEGLSVINENPFVSSKPLLGKIEDLKDALIASLFSPGNGRNRPSGAYTYGADMNGPYGMSSSPPQYEAPPFRAGPTLDPVSRQSANFYHSDANPFARR